VSSFALVAYIPDPLCKFLDDLRRELAPGCVPHAHVTILPPRRLSAAPEAAIEAVRSRISDFSAFQVMAGEVMVFPGSDVVYLSIGQGGKDLLHMHGVLNVGPLNYQAAFPFHPHITLAQELTPERSVECAALARRRWSEYSGSRKFPVESLVFVQNTAGNLWTDLAHFQLDPAPSIRR
jgi:2'-5' RNA ligase